MQTNCAWIILANNLHQSFAQIALAIKLWEPVATIRYKLEITRETGYHSLYIKIASIFPLLYINEIFKNKCLKVQCHEKVCVRSVMAYKYRTNGFC